MNHNDPMSFVPEVYFQGWKDAHKIPQYRHPYIRFRKDPANGHRVTAFKLFDIQMPLGLTGTQVVAKLVYKSTESRTFWSERAYLNA